MPVPYFKVSGEEELQLDLTGASGLLVVQTDNGTYHLNKDHLLFRTDNAVDIGGANYRFKNVYSATGHFDSLVSPAATSSTAGLMSAADKTKLDSVGTVFTFKGSVADSTALPASGNTTGDAYAVEDTGTVSVWDGTAWVDLGQWDGMVPATNAQIDAIFAA